ncbi:MAG TPA: tRNA uridine-5-carboxymethylaminomethyl(34) synthesis GTPase MnmE [Pseudolabrys sp.]|nr:tRNA uridine-5-carboxymethylaminomethyl(34) synthesis GTPase MnmE [Pseudolabrys sp.]
MTGSVNDTIYALSSGRLPAAIGVVRISGTRAGAALEALTGKIPAPRQAALVRVRGRDGELIDQALGLWFPAPHSETGEDVAELQLHGGRAVIAAVFAALSQIEGLRPAEAGEFTRRAFENGKLDLTEVEGLADLVLAETEGQRRQAFRQMTGVLGDRAESWRAQLIQALALVEARIDFSDEADVPQDLLAPALRVAQTLADEIAAVLADGGCGERLREGLVVAIAGPPNAGKSTLLNRIARREAAIVSPYAGTTRDVIEVHLNLNGLPVTVLDTAGIRDTEDPVEFEGVRRARERAAAADLILWVVDASECAEVSRDEDAQTPTRELGHRAGTRALRSGTPSFGVGGSGSRAGTMGKNGSVESKGDQPLPSLWLVRNKIDLLQRVNKNNESKLQCIDINEPRFQFNEVLSSIVNKMLPQNYEYKFILNESLFDISATSGDGLDHLLGKLTVTADQFLVGTEPALVTRERHRRALEDAEAALRRALKPEISMHEDLFAEELRTAAHALGRLTGRVDVEDVLEVIFRDFCIGK